MNSKAEQTIRWMLKISVAEERQHSLLYRSKYRGVGVQAEIHTPKRKNGTFGKEKRAFFIDNQKGEHKTEQELKVAVDEFIKKDGEFCE